MPIIVHPMLAAQRAVLDLPPDERRAALLNMLAPFESMLRIMTPPGGDPTTMMGLMRPDGPTAAYADALARLEAANAEETCRAAMDGAARAIEATGYQPPIDTIQFGLFLLETNPQMMKLLQGYTGFGGVPGYITVSLWPDDRNLPMLGACVAHEFNHQIRLSFEPWRMDISVGEYVVMEGLAESFAAELFGPEFVGPWITEVQPAALATARQVLGQALEVRGFNEVRPYIFGDEVLAAFGGDQPVGVPAYAGYAVGFQVVQAYLRKTGKTAAEATLVPSAEILRVADFF
jgi:uncharacterized protein YjaZ